MKKSLLSIALVAVVSMTASAASIKWSSAALSFGSASLKDNANVTGYFIYLADGAVLPSYTVDALFSPSSIGTQVSIDNDGTPRTGKVTGAHEYLFSDASGVYNNGDTFTLLLSYKNGDETWWNLASATQSLSGVSEDGDSFKTSDYAFNMAINEPGTPLSAGGGWVKAVPEPATGALALAGLALLFRRKKA